MNHKSIIRIKSHPNPFAELQRLTLANGYQLSIAKATGAHTYEIAAYNRQGLMYNSLIGCNDVIKHLTESQVLDYIDILAGKE